MEDAAVHAAAAHGVRDAAEPLPHHAAIQAAFGRHDVSHIRARVGGDAAAAAGAIGARAYARDDKVAFAGTPDLHTAAHEAAHVVQQRAGVVALKGGVGSEGDRYEQHADRVADAVVAGRSAEAILDELAPDGAASTPTPAVQRKPGDTDVANAARYLRVNSRDAGVEIKRHLAAVGLPLPHPRLVWHDSGAFWTKLFEQLNSLVGDFERPSELVQVLYPADPYAVVDGRRPILGTAKATTDDGFTGGAVGPLDWKATVGTALGQLFEAAIVASLRRLAPRWLARADRASDSGSAEGTSVFVPFDGIALSHHMDRAVARAMCVPQVFDVKPDPAAKTKRKRKRADASQPLEAVRPVELEYLGQEPKTRTLWNWVKATNPTDATVEEVAASLFGYAAESYGEANTSFLAYGITAAPPYFALPAKWALRLPEMAEHAPAKITDADNTAGGHFLALAGTTAADDLALLEAADAKSRRKDAPPATPEVIGELLNDSLTQTGYLKQVLAPWKLEAPLDKTYGFLGRKLGELDDPAQAAQWEHVIRGQKENLATIGAAVGEIDRAAKTLGIKDKTGPDARALREVLELYAQAAATSHLVDTSGRLIEQAAARQAGLAQQSVATSTQQMDTAMDLLRDSVPLGDDTRKSLAGHQATIAHESQMLQSRMIRGEQVSAAEIEKVTMDADEVALRARSHAIIEQLRALETAAHEGSDSIAENFALLFSSDFRSLEGATSSLRMDIEMVVHDMDFQNQMAGISYDFDHGGSIEEYDRIKHDARKQALAAAQQRFTAISRRTDIAKFLRRGAELVKWQAFRTACVKVAALVGISIVAGAVGGMVTRAVGGLFMEAGAATTVAELGIGARLVAGGAGIATDTAIASAGQVAVFGGSYSDAFLENAIAALGSHAILKALTFDVKAAEKLEAASRGLWKRAGVPVLSEAAKITGHTIMGAALGYVAHRIVTGKKQPPPETLEEWLLQGASIAVGRYVGKGIESRLAGYKKLGALKGFAPGERLLAQAKELKLLSDGLERKPDNEGALEVMARRHKLLMDELEVLDALVDNPQRLRESGLKPHEIRAMRDEIDAQLDEVHAAGFAAVPLHLAGLEELVPGAVWKGTRDEIELALRSAQRTGLKVEAARDATGHWKATLDGRPMEFHERTPVGVDAVPATAKTPGAAAPREYERVTIAPDHVRGERGATTGLVPGSSFRGSAVKHANLQAESAHAATLMQEVGYKLPGLTDLVPGVKQIQHAEGARFIVTLDDAVSTRTTVEVIVGPLDGETVARAVINPTKRGATVGKDGTIQGRHTIELSVGLDPAQVERALAGQLASIVHAQTTMLATGRNAKRDVLSHGEQPGALGPNDLGRVAEINAIARQITEQPARAAVLRQELVALVEHLGIRQGVTDADLRHGMMETHLTKEARAELATARRGEWELSTDERAALHRQRDQSFDHMMQELVRNGGPGDIHGLPPALAPKGQVADRAKIAEAARIAARLREMVSEKTLQRYREKARAAGPGKLAAVEDLQVGGGAALAARRPGALLVDARGRWQSDGSTDLAQTGHQLDSLRDAGIGDPREVAGPNERVPLEAIRYWEDAIAARGEVIDGTAAFRVADDGTLVVDIRPTDGSPVLTLAVKSTPTIATGFPPEKAPGAARGITVSDSILLLGRGLDAIAGNPQASPNVRQAAKHAATQLHAISGESIQNASLADRVLDGLPLTPAERSELRALLEKDHPRAKDALATLDASDEWVGLKNRDKGQQSLFLGDEANLESIRRLAHPDNPEAPKHVVFAGTGGTAISAAEIILSSNRNTKVTLLGRDMPPGLVENDQFRQVADAYLDKKSAAALGLPHGDGRLEIILDKDMSLGMPTGNKDGTYTAWVDPKSGRAYTGDAYVSALGRENQVPPVVSSLMMEARRAGGTVAYTPLLETGRYLGYKITIEIPGKKTYHFEVTGAVSRYVPRGDWSVDPNAVKGDAATRIERSGNLDAPPTGGNFDAGYAATADQAHEYAVDRKAKGRK